MEELPSRESRNGTFERHAQSLVLAIMTLLLGWAGSTLVDLGKAVAKQDVVTAQTIRDVSEMRTEIKALREQVTVAALAAAQAATAAALAALAHKEKEK